VRAKISLVKKLSDRRSTLDKINAAKNIFFTHAG
jgi:hypothetical protein